MAHPRSLLDAHQHRVEALLEGDLAETFVEAPRREAGVLLGESVVDPDLHGIVGGDREQHVGLFFEVDLGVGVVGGACEPLLT
ncbi:MAG: hypothetical protein PF961_03535 [Planctomycetota bacterium]|nr:hypothetical protein [Planctomycetota bacterium]